MEIVTSMIVQLDARRRQVAVNVKVVDVNLLNTEEFNSSLSFGVGDGFFVSDNGAAALNYGGVNPPTSGAVTTGVYPQPIISNPLTTIGGGIFFDPQDAPFSDINRAFGAPYARPDFGTYNNPFQPGVSEIGDDGEITFDLPSLFQYPSKFLALLQAKIESGNGKILTDPTLVVQEGETAEIQLTQEVFGGFTRKQIVNPDGSSSTVDEPIIKNAGLLLNVAVDRIDDNGFISVNVNPTISGISGSQNTPQGTITLTQERSSRSGVIRLRDGQTLILSGIIQESDRTTVSKVPILGDIPLLGALFRSTNRQNSRNEVVVLVTPQIVDDSQQSGWGYNYSPGPATRDALRKQGMTVPGGR
jgi:type IV pilus assembly protein PilQ